MSKSLQNIVPLRDAVEKFGADPVRIGVLATAELGQDTDFSEQLAQSIEERLSSMLNQAKKLGKTEKAAKRKDSILDKWMLHRVNEAVRVTTSAMDNLRVREAIQRVLYQLDNDIAWYQRRLSSKKTGRTDTRDGVIRTVLEARAKMLAPLAPHTCEEIWSLLGGKGFVSLADWPTQDAKLDDIEAEYSEYLVRQVMEDTSEILKATGIKPSRITFYTAPDWKWKVYLRALQFAADNKDANPGDFIKSIMADPEMRTLGKASADYSGKALQQARQLQEMRNERILSGRRNETNVLEEGRGFFEKEFRSTVNVFRADSKDSHDPKDRARTAEPYRPAIYIE